MVSLLLVEDESFERESLINCIDWELIGVKIIGEAANGSQGLAKALEFKPDIILSDVKMPVMDGLEMSRHIRQSEPDIRILFLSSYDDFEYAKQAIDLNISAYLMKPVNEVELLRVVKKIVDEINTERVERQLLLKRQDNLSISLKLARQALVSRVLGGMHVDEADARNLGLDWLFLPEQAFVVAHSEYETGLLDPIDDKLEQLGKRFQRLPARSINVCVRAGHLVTLYAPFDNTQGDSTQTVQQTLSAFFRDMGAEARVMLAGGQNLAALQAQLLQDSMQNQRSLAGNDKRKQNKEQIVTQIKTIIAQEYQSPITLESVARTLHFTPNYLGYLFKSVTKISVNRYLLQTRLSKAKDLLRTGNQSLNDVAEQCGFGSNTYFHSSFKKETGMTPKEYRYQFVRGGSASDGTV